MLDFVARMSPSKTFSSGCSCSFCCNSGSSWLSSSSVVIDLKQADSLLSKRLKRSSAHQITYIVIKDIFYYINKG